MLADLAHFTRAEGLLHVIDERHGAGSPIKTGRYALKVPDHRVWARVAIDYKTLIVLNARPASTVRWRQLVRRLKGHSTPTRNGLLRAAHG